MKVVFVILRTVLSRDAFMSLKCKLGKVGMQVFEFVRSILWTVYIRRISLFQIRTIITSIPWINFRILSKSNGILIVKNTCLVFQSRNVYLARDFWHAVGSFNLCLVFGVIGTCHACHRKGALCGVSTASCACRNQNGIWAGDCQNETKAWGCQLGVWEEMAFIENKTKSKVKK